MPRLRRTFRSVRDAAAARPRAWGIAAGVGAAVLVGVVALVVVLGRGGGGAPAPSRAAGGTDDDDAAPAAGPVEPAARPAGVVTFAEGCVTPACHASLIAGASTHEPVVRDACGTCHEPDTGGHVYPVARVRGDDLCSSCHETGADRPVRHGAMTQGACLACHRPHVSDGPALLAASSVRATCDGCHLVAEGVATHAPYERGDCTACHDPHGASNERLLVGGEGAEHCVMCHAPVVADMAVARHTHAGLEGECLACHGAHATEHPGLLTAPAGEQCMACHEGVRRTVSEAVVTHDPVLTGDRCVTCHAPHASDNPSMLQDDQTDVCLSCHDEEVRASDGRLVRDMGDVIRGSAFVHGPVASSRCSACHAIHGAQHARLLEALNPALLTGTFDVSNYALCFSCHDQDLVLEARTTTTTRFRDGAVNLHNLHVTARGSRNCADCHAVHGADGPHLIAEAVAYQGSDWMMPMNYVPTEHGGTCAPGCHDALGYDRRKGDGGGDAGGAR